MRVHVEAGRLRSLRRAAGIAAAAAMSLYLLVKVIWIALEVAQGSAEWVLLNAVTVVMALAGIGLGLALAQPWGMRLPAWLVLPVGWIAGGFLVSMLPYMAVSSLLVPSVPEPAAESALPAWETVFIGVGFAGMAVALVVGLPLFLRERWPWAFTGRVGGNRASGRTRWILLPVAALAALWAYWAAGGTAGLDPAALSTWDANARLLTANSALGAVCAGWSLWALGRWGSPRTPMWLPMALGFVASGSLFSWGAWKSLWLLLPGTYQPAELRGVALIEHATAVAAGLAILVTLLGVYRRRRASSR
ncbi:hypothetical protein [Nonomuraea insulae]|uniref:Uncharacterized protein n=1 Tax=Nonomuraea insulae TaxID=1616787 RepID=A0ABW1CKA5_9ACTN